ncbi:PREDICTED: gastrula zinc finger protein XlCGF66.1-like [Nanorana parkeri]|uniref:gastrula zinc finger protein XlCGF66.1-like n=1 Tax=Nanorana parkeri TaxID=125878 RepID=UPI0008547B9C|nr:PREDICTED: gastrula zinc finger protein XlCGF66.1-like [Nanorana parkeri]
METIALTGSRRMSAVHHTTAYVAMEKDEKSHMTERMLNLTLEIIYLLTGEKYAAVKMTCIEGFFQGMYPPMSERWCRSQKAIAVPPPILERNNVEKIQDITNMLIELLTGEVPISCQDVTDCLSKENDYLEGHKELYKDAMMENRPPLTSPGKRRLYCKGDGST